MRLDRDVVLRTRDRKRFLICKGKRKLIETVTKSIRIKLEGPVNLHSFLDRMFVGEFSK